MSENVHTCIYTIIKNNKKKLSAIDRPCKSETYTVQGHYGHVIVVLDRDLRSEININKIKNTHIIRNVFMTSLVLL